MRLLVVEDEQALLTSLTELLSQQGYSVDGCADGEYGLFQACEVDYDLAIVDLGLPKIDGLELIRQMRKNGVTTPVIILTARNQWQEKVKGLELGADDYVTKPFQPDELLARVKALLRRSAGIASADISYGPVSMNLNSNNVVLTVNNEAQPVDLTAYEYKVLEYLFLNPHKVISKTELTEHIYDQDFDLDSNVIEVFVGRLRKKLDQRSGIAIIETLRGRGYRLHPSIAN